MRTETLLDLADKWDPPPDPKKPNIVDENTDVAEVRRARRQCAEDLRALLELLS
jgi:hypothetical protein